MNTMQICTATMPPYGYAAASSTAAMAVKDHPSAGTWTYYFQAYCNYSGSLAERSMLALECKR